MRDDERQKRKTVPLQPERHRREVQFSSLVPGHLFDERYRIVRSLGAGGTGEVFLAEDRLAGGEVALKVLFPGRETDHMLRRLRRELEIVRSLNHPGIVRIDHMGEAQGLFYFVMEMLEGSTLRSRIENGSIPVHAAIEILDALAESLAVAHASGVVHRDIKPDNVFLARSPGGEGERVVLLDFGIALREGDTRFTSTGDLIGTPHYLAPEQARGDTEIGPAADVYALGALTWEMLSGEPVFGGGNAMQIVQAHLSRPVPGNSGFPRETPAWLVRIVRRMLAKKRADRPANGAEVLAMIRRQHVPRLTSRTLRRGGIVAAVALLGAIVLWLTVDFTPGVPAGVRPSGETTFGEIVDPAGEPLDDWNERIAEVLGRNPASEQDNIREIARVAVLDSGDWPETKLVVAASHVGPPWSCTLHLFDGRSRDLESELRLPILGPDRHVPTQLHVENGDVLDVDFVPLSLSATEIDGRPGEEIVIAATSSRTYPSQVLVLDRAAEEAPLVDHWNMGNCRAVPVDLDGDGTDELILHGANNAFQEAWITILDPRASEFATKTRSPPGHRRVALLELDDYPVGGLTIRFPRVAVSRDMGSPFHFIRGSSRSADWDDEARILRVVIRDGTSRPGGSSAYTMAYTLDFETGTIRIEWLDYDGYLARFQDAFGADGDPWGVIEQESLRPYESTLIGEITQWDGDAGDREWKPLDLAGIVDRFRPVAP